MLNNRELGKVGENLAEKYILQQGYTILHRNYRTKLGEIDIVAMDGKYIVFIEVKSRKSISYGYPREAVDRHKQEKIREVANIYLLQHKKISSSCRFDVIEIMLNYNNTLKSITQLRNAF